MLALLGLLFVWNVRVVEGIRCHAPLPTRREQPAWEEQTVAPELPNLPVEEGACVAPLPVAPPLPEEPPPATSTAAPRGSEPPATSAVEPSDPVVAALVKAGFCASVAQRPGWTWDRTSRSVRSPQGTSYRLVHIEPKASHLDLRFRAYTSEDRASTKGFHVAGGVGKDLLDTWNARPRGRRGRRPVPPKPTVEPGAWLRSHDPTRGGPRLVPDWPNFMAASARAAAVAATSKQGVWVDVYIPPVSAPKRHPLIADTVAQRRRQRLSHAERLARMAALPGTCVSVRVTTLRSGPTIVPASRPME